ncbi:hypothetical protein [Sinomonas soli]
MSAGSDDLPDFDREEALAQARVVHRAWEFLQAFYAGDLASAWLFMDPTLRLCWAQWWVQANDESLHSGGCRPEDVIAALAVSPGRGHRLWSDFSRDVVRDFQKAFPLDVDSAGIGATPRALGLDIELLYVHREPPAGGPWKPGGSSEVVPMVMSLSHGEWKVLNLGYEAIPTPGYPPALNGPA